MCHGSIVVRIRVSRLALGLTSCISNAIIYGLALLSCSDIGQVVHMQICNLLTSLERLGSVLAPVILLNLVFRIVTLHYKSLKICFHFSRTGKVLEKTIWP